MRLANPPMASGIAPRVQITGGQGTRPLFNGAGQLKVRGVKLHDIGASQPDLEHRAGVTQSRFPDDMLTVLHPHTSLLQRRT